MKTHTAPAFLSAAPQFTVPDVVAASRYYSEVLGFLSSGFFGNPPVFAIVARGSVEFFFNQNPGGGPVTRQRAPGAYDAYIRITGVDALFEELSARGAKIIDGPCTRVYGMRELVIEDCHGLVIAFGEGS